MCLADLVVRSTVCATLLRPVTVNGNRPHRFRGLPGAGVAQRARIVLLAADGVYNTANAEWVGIASNGDRAVGPLSGPGDRDRSTFGMSLNVGPSRQAAL
jgi:hypothetical protein